MVNCNDNPNIRKISRIQDIIPPDINSPGQKPPTKDKNPLVVCDNDWKTLHIINNLENISKNKKVKNMVARSKRK